MIDSVAYILFFFPALIAFLLISSDQAYYSWTINETSEQTPWRPLLWPFKLVLALAWLLLLVQGVSETIKSVYAARTGIELEHKEKVEV
jgi:TRAP-type mannitol/chloroaromatic compound transport system permease small subunit